MGNSIAEIAVPRDIDKTFDYQIPENFVERSQWGVRVRVPFSGDELTGIIIGLKSESEFKGKLRLIKGVVDETPVLDEHRYELACWISSYYLTPIGMVLSAMIPAGVHKRSPRKRNYIHLNTNLEETVRWIERLSRSAPRQADVLKALLVKPIDPLMNELLSEVGATSGPLKSLEKKGVVEIVRTPISHAVRSKYHESFEDFELTNDQQNALIEIKKAQSRNNSKLLIHGINASGKTEVYIRAVQQVLDLGLQAIVTVPEISLTPQVISRFQLRFGEKMAVYHSQLTEAQRSHEWQRILRGEADVVVGVRSVLFAPLERLGAIIIDEEHESTYKQEDPAPRYHVREVAYKRAELANAVVILGSATPSLETYRRSQVGGVQLIEMKNRVIKGRLPDVKVVESKIDKGMISEPLKSAISQKVAAGEQVMLLLNLRGFSRALFCLSCREVQRCPNCNLALVYHLKEQRLRCHVCGQNFPVGKCRNCNSADLKHMGAGTEQVERELKELYPGIGFARMDSDSLARGEHGEILEALRQGEVQILLGTQMIALGLDFPNVSLVGILSADTMLNLPDFRAGERTFQLISQAMGRAGRGEAQGQVIIQTLQPDHYALSHAVNHDYAGFYHEELSIREAFGFPPFKHLIKLSIENKNEEKVVADAASLKDLIDAEAMTDVEILEPFKGMPYRLRGDLRWHLVIKTNSTEVVVKRLKNVLERCQLSSSLKIDVDPQSLVF
jgi:primosomal protein N' (replication factor Y)